ncbi:class E sortase [Streptomyces sp. NPDC059828]|uniref:class E sortase n=1 Tax=Streptomyces sp. NPDC059828 TaxID=3346965 RepID=UPI00365FA2CE
MWRHGRGRPLGRARAGGGRQGPGMNGEGGAPWLRDGSVPGHSPAPEQWDWTGYGRYATEDSPGYEQDWYGQQYAPADEAAAHRTTGGHGRHAAHRAGPGSSPWTSEVPASVPESPAGSPERPPGGRAERRRAAKGRRRAGGAPASTATGQVPSEEGAPLTRVEARRRARALKDSPAVVASRVFGELFITVGVLMLLFVTYQLWWTNILAGQQANAAANQIQDDWAKGRAPGAFEPGQGFAIMHIPKLDVVVPIAEGIDKHSVLDRGMVGHYADGALKTAMPSDKQGNFAVAGHRNTHGEPFRYINRLAPGDPIVVETQDAYYTYKMASILPQTAPSNTSVIAPVPDGSGFTDPGRYITLTTCTPEFTSTYRMIVWGKMVDERPRSKGKPDALVG